MTNYTETTIEKLVVETKAGASFDNVVKELIQRAIEYRCNIETTFNQKCLVVNYNSLTKTFVYEE